MLRLTDVWKRFDGVAALSGVSFDARPGEIHALLGENGAGKSTLMAIAAGSLRPDSGTIELGGESREAVTPIAARAAGLSIVYQHPALAPDLTVMENVTMALPGQVRSRGRGAGAWVGEQLARVGCTAGLSERVASIDVVQRQLLEIGKALAADPRVLILDEPTAALGLEETETLFGELRRLAAAGTAIVYITHRLAEVREVCGRVTVLRDGEGRGTYEVAATTDDEILRMIVGRAVQATFPAKHPGATGSSPVLTVDGLSSTAVHDVDLEVRPGEILGLGGIVGNGQGGVLRALAGLEPATGTVDLGGAVVPLGKPAGSLAAGILYLSPDRLSEGLFGALSVRENATVAALDQFRRFGLVDRAAESRAVEAQRSALAVRTSSIEANVLHLSGGNQQKVLLSRALIRSDVKLILADEPTQGVDVGARIEIYRILREAADTGVAVLVVSSDVRELVGLCDRVSVLSAGHVVAAFEGDDVREDAITHAMVTSTQRRREQADPARPTGRASEAGRRVRTALASTYGASGILAVAIVVVGLYTQAHSSRYLTTFNLTSLTFLIASLGLVALGEACVILTGGIDLSVGPLAGLVVVIGSFFENAGHSGAVQVAGFAVMLLAGVGTGLLNGVLVQIAGFTPVAATLVTYIGLQGLSLVLRPFQGGYIATPIINGLSKNVGPIAVAFLVTAGLSLLAEYALRRRMWGFNLRAYGSRADAAFRLGVRPVRTVIGAYVLCALFASLGGMLLMAQVGVGDPTQGVSYTLAAVTAVVLGGTSILGGRGSFIGVLLGAVLVEQLLNVTTFLHLTEAYQYWFQGALVFIAVGLYTRAGRDGSSTWRRRARQVGVAPVQKEALV